MSGYSAQKCLVIWAGIAVVALVVGTAITLMANRYNDTERDRANLCTAEHGAYVDGHCVWTVER